MCSEHTIRANIFSSLKKGEDEFIRELNKLDPEIITSLVDNELINNYTCLQLACCYNFRRAVVMLLEYGADPEKSTSRNPKTPLEIVASRGYNKIFKILLEHENVQINDNEILIELLFRVTKVKEPQKQYFKTCYDLYMNSSKKPDINKPSKRGLTPLAYSAQYCTTDLTLDLLRHGASLAARNENEEADMALVYVDCFTLEKHFDECLEVDLKHLKNHIDKESFTVTYNYRTLMPPKKHLIKKDDIKENKVNFESLNQQDSTPLIDFCTSLTNNNNVIIPIDENKFIQDANSNLIENKQVENSKISKKDLEVTPESEVVSYMCESSDLKHLLKHPVITSFIYMKWKRISWFYTVNCLRNVSMFILFILQALSFNIMNQKFTIVLVFVRFFTVLVYLMSIGFALRIGILRTSSIYFCVNDLPALMLYFIIILLPLFWAKQLSAIAVFSFAFKLLFFIGQHTTNIQVFKTVTANFVKFLLLYMILIVAFAISFFTMANKNIANEMADFANHTNFNSSEFYYPIETFAVLGTAFFKTCLMLAGEFDTDLTHFPSFPVISHVIFIVFIFVIPINLLNFLNGLAVCDIQNMKKEAGIASLKSKIKLISSLEKDLIINYRTDKIKITIKNLPTIIRLKIRKFFYYRFSQHSLAKEVCLFPHILNDYKLEIYPNQGGRIKITKRNENVVNNNSISYRFLRWFSGTSYFKLNRMTVKNTRLLIKEKKEAERDELNVQMKTIKILHESIEKLIQGQRNLQKKVAVVYNPLKRRFSLKRPSISK